MSGVYAVFYCICRYAVRDNYNYKT